MAIITAMMTNDIRFTLRLPQSLHKYLQIRKEANHRSLNAEIVFTLTEARRQAELPGAPYPAQLERHGVYTWTGPTDDD